VKLDVVTSHDAAAGRVADELAATLAAGARVLALPTGRTMVAVYEALVRRPIDWSRLATFNLDEFASVGPSHPGSYRAYMDAHLFNRVALPASAIEFLRGDAPDIEAECARYEAALAAAGGLDLALLGIGANGHIGFNEPADALRAETHVVSLHEATRRANADRFGHDWRQVPAQALTLGMRRLLQARRVIVVASGQSKAEAVAAAVHGPLTTRCPASWLQVHPDATLVVDVEAAPFLSGPAR
jgi:glucosamine-6-phosphate deaminase